MSVDPCTRPQRDPSAAMLVQSAHRGRSGIVPILGMIRCQSITGPRHSVREANRCQLPPISPTAMNESTASQPDAHDLPREARGRQNRLLRAHVGILPQSRPPSSTCSHRQARLSPGRTQGWTQRRPWRTRTVIESGHWKAGDPGLRVLCSSQATKD
jgi:hypothetical protein